MILEILPFHEFNWCCYLFFFCLIGQHELQALTLVLCINLYTGLFQLAHTFIPVATMSYVHYRFRGTLAVTAIWESFLLIQF